MRKKEVEAGKAYVNTDAVTPEVFFVHSVEYQPRFGKQAQLAHVSRLRPSYNMEEGVWTMRVVGEFTFGCQVRSSFDTWVDSNFGEEVPMGKPEEWETSE